MKTREVLRAIDAFMDHRLLRVGHGTITIGSTLMAIAVVLLTLLVSRLLMRAVSRGLAKRGLEHEGTVGAAGSLVRYVVLIIGVGLALETLGIDLSTLFAAGAVFAVGIGFAMQNIAQNFVAGVILLMERSIKPGDVLLIDDEQVRIRELGIRSTIATTLNGENVLIPNSTLIQTAVKNLTLTDDHIRLVVTVGVSYDSDMKKVREVLEAVVAEFPDRLPTHLSRIFMADFGDSSVNFDVTLWTAQPWRAPWDRSRLREAIWVALKQADITIAYPQLDVHFDAAVPRDFDPADPKDKG